MTRASFNATTFFSYLPTPHFFWTLWPPDFAFSGILPIRNLFEGPDDFDVVLEIVQEVVLDVVL